MQEIRGPHGRVLILNENVLRPVGEQTERNEQGRMYPFQQFEVTDGPLAGLRGRVERFVDERGGEPHYLVEFANYHEVLDGYRNALFAVLAYGNLDRDAAILVAKEALNRLRA